MSAPACARQTVNHGYTRTACRDCYDPNNWIQYKFLAPDSFPELPDRSWAPVKKNLCFGLWNPILFKYPTDREVSQTHSKHFFLDTSIRKTAGGRWTVNRDLPRERLVEMVPTRFVCWNLLPGNCGRHPNIFENYYLFYKISKLCDTTCRPCCVSNFSRAKTAELELSEIKSAHDNLATLLRISDLNWDFSIKTCEN